MKQISWLLCCLLSILLGLATFSRAEPAVAEGDDADSWQFTLTPYFWALSLDGDIDADRVDAEVSADFSDILDNTNIAAMVVLEARRDPWCIVVDSLFAELEDDDAGVGPLRVESRTRQTVIDAKLGRRIWGRSDPRDDSRPRFTIDVLGGARYVRDRNEIDAQLGPIGRDVDETFDWVDAVLGARLRLELSPTTSFSLSADGGGFGIGSSSDFTWSGIGVFTWQPWRSWSLSIGYKVLDIDRDKIDIQQHGPALGASYHF